MKKQDALLVSIVGDILVVGRKNEGDVPVIINAFQGEEAVELYNRLTTVKKGSDES